MRTSRDFKEVDSDAHAPRYRYDCSRCKFNWCCGYSCSCALRGEVEQETPLRIRRKVAREIHRVGDNAARFSVEGVLEEKSSHGDFSRSGRIRKVDRKKNGRSD